MTWSARFYLVLLLSAAACKTAGKDRDSGLAAWELDGNKQAAQDFIIRTVQQFYRDTQGQKEPLQRFAQALADKKTDQTESATYVLQSYYERSKDGSLEGEMSPLQQYILQQFVIMTNYIAFNNDPAGNALQFVGN